jgi:hypothetical protein
VKREFEEGVDDPEMMKMERPNKMMETMSWRSEPDLVFPLLSFGCAPRSNPEPEPLQLPFPSDFNIPRAD